MPHRLIKQQWSQRNAVSVLDSVADAILSVDRQGRILYSNSAAERLFGYGVDELLGTLVTQLMPEPQASLHQRQIEEYLSTGESRIIGHTRELVGLRRSGERFPLQLTLSELETDGGTHFAAVMLDRTESNARQVSLHAQREQLARAGRLSTLGEMTASIAHEMNQPLTAIAMYAQACERLLHQDTIDVDRLLDALNKLSDQALRAGAVNERVQHFVRSEDSPQELQNLNDLLLDIRPLAAGDARAHGIELDYQLADSLPQVNCLGINIQQITLNLLRNAFDAMAEMNCENGSTVLLESEFLPAGSGADAAGDRIRVSVSDQGPGVAEQDAASLFDPFRTSKKSGMGLGLASCRSLIAEEGGLLDFTNRQPHGAVFYFTLPIASAPIATVPSHP